MTLLAGLFSLVTSVVETLGLLLVPITAIVVVLLYLRWIRRQAERAAEPGAPPALPFAERSTWDRLVGLSSLRTGYSTVESLWQARTSLTLLAWACLIMGVAIVPFAVSQGMVWVPLVFFAGTAVAFVLLAGTRRRYRRALELQQNAGSSLEARAAFSSLALDEYKRSQRVSRGAVRFMGLELIALVVFIVGIVVVPTLAFRSNLGWYGVGSGIGSMAPVVALLLVMAVLILRLMPRSNPKKDPARDRARFTQATGAVVLAPESRPDVIEALGRAAATSGIACPGGVLMIPCSCVNAFVVGSAEDPTVAVTYGLLATFQPDELEAVFTQLLVRIRVGIVSDSALAWYLKARWGERMPPMPVLSVPPLYQALDDQALLLMRDPEPLIAALRRTIEAQDTRVPGLGPSFFQFLWTWPKYRPQPQESFSGHGVRGFRVPALDHVEQARIESLRR